MTGKAAWQVTDRQLVFAHPSFTGVIGVGRRDITPPLGIYARAWGAATSDTAEGIHRPLLATALAMSTPQDTAPLVLLALDLGSWGTPADEWVVRGQVLDGLGLDESRLLMTLSHTHAGPSTSMDNAAKPGGALIRPYLETVAEACLAAAQEAIATRSEATLAWATGRCALAQNRDLFDGERHACGYNPHAPADDTLLVGRITSTAGRVLATVVNYACHPTTLAWENRLISPDYVGAMRELVESQTGQAPCLFLQGASGELAPRDQYSGETAWADRNGRVLGYAVLSILEGMLPSGTQLDYAGRVESGTALGIWQRTARSGSSTLQATHMTIDVELKDLPSLEGEQGKTEITARVLSERLSRQRMVRQALGDGRTAGVDLWLWRLGETILVGQPNEAYSWLQTELRRCFPDYAVVVLNLTGGYGPAYLPRADLYDSEDLYPVWQTPYARGSLERLAQAAKVGITQRLLVSG